MLCVIAAIEVLGGRRNEFLAAVGEILPTVRTERGCIEYGPMLDLPSGLPGQPPVRENVVTMLEKWEDLASLEVHLKSPHMQAFFDKTAGLRRGLTLQVLAPA